MKIVKDQITSDELEALKTRKIQHKDLAAGRWAKMSLCEQMANIGSEVSRALNWKKKGNEEYCKKAVYRAIELLLLSIDSVTVKSHYKELTRVNAILS